MVHDEAGVGEYLLLSESEGSLQYSEFYSDNELDDHALLHVVVNDGSDEDYNITQDFVWENMENYKGQRENFTGSVGPQEAAKHFTEIVDVLEVFFSRELTDTIVKETNRYVEQFLYGHELSIRSPYRAWKPVTQGDIYVLLDLFMLQVTL
jgi:hypothetical protein